MPKTGDTVRYLNSVGGGRIVRIDGQIAYVDEDGFENPVLLKECVVVASLDSQKGAAAFTAARTAAAAEAPKPAPAPQRPEPEPFVVEETPGGDVLNVVLAYEAADLRRISTTTFDTYLVNDSNYYLYYTYMTRADDRRDWTLRHAGMVEPGIQVFVGEVQRDDLAGMDRVALQLVAFKRQGDFELKQPVSVEFALDTTKFCKLHCFRPNEYFDQPVIAVPVVKDDLPYRQTGIDGGGMRQAMMQKQREDRRPARPAGRGASAPAVDPLVVDLHIHELVDNTAGLSNSDMLNLQIDRFRRIMDENLRNVGRRIIFIHGKGDGVLRAALLKELNHRYKDHEVQDASFREYGYGATQVRIRSKR